MLHDIIFLVMGIAMLVIGGNMLTDGAVAVAKKLNVSNLVIGMTVVAFGSAAPDLVVCLASTIEGKTQLALGDIVGGNIFDITVVIGAMAVARPFAVRGEMLRRDLPMLLFATLLLFLCGDDSLVDGVPANVINRTDGLIMLTVYVIFFYSDINALRATRLQPKTVTVMTTMADRAAQPPAVPVWRAWAGIVAGLALLVVGGNWVVDGASGIALRAGMTEAMVGLTVVAIGNSAPDLAASLSATIKGHPSLALGNVIGTSIINILFIGGLCATVAPQHAGTIGTVDFGVLLGSAALVLMFASLSRTNTVSRPAGVVLVAVYVAYMAYLVIPALG